MVGELTRQNQNLQDRIAEQDMVVQGLESLRKLGALTEPTHAKASITWYVTLFLSFVLGVYHAHANRLQI